MLAIVDAVRRRGEASNYIPPISLVLGSEPKNYVGGLGAYSQGKASIWCERFAYATARAAREAEELAQRIEGLQTTWLDRLGQPRRDAAVRQLVSALPAHPVIDVPAAQQLTDKSHVAVGHAIAQLEEAGILKQLNEREKLAALPDTAPFAQSDPDPLLALRSSPRSSCRTECAPPSPKRTSATRQSRKIRVISVVVPLRVGQRSKPLGSVDALTGKQILIGNRQRGKES